MLQYINIFFFHLMNKELMFSKKTKMCRFVIIKRLNVNNVNVFW